MYKFKWSDLVDDAFATELGSAAGIDQHNEIEKLKELAISIIEARGGLPLLKKELKGKDFKAISRGLLYDALREAYSDVFKGHGSRGMYLKNAPGKPFKSGIQLDNVVFVNYASAEELDKLPVIGKALAADIVAERRTNGMFSGAMDMANRIKGIGKDSALDLIPLLRFRKINDKQAAASDLTALIEQLISFKGGEPSVSFIEMLEFTLAFNKKKAKKKWLGDMSYEKQMPSKTHACKWIGILKEEEYYFWVSDAINNAQKSIDLAMFHIAMPTKNHPTLRLINNLIEAKKRNVKVRVFLDRDRPDDPYMSSVINESAFKMLKAGGVSVRYDKQDNLLHSKFLLIDKETVVMGSHNWSAGSYFHYDDVSLVMQSEEATAEMKKRFDKLWAG